MIRFVGRWLADCIQLIGMLAGALLFMQIPAFTHTYTVALLQVAQDARHDVDRREADARQYYHLPADADDQAVVAALRPVEPSNAETLLQSMRRAAMYRDTQDRITAAPTLSQPIAAVWDAASRPDADKLGLLSTSLTSYAPQIMLDVNAVIYGIIGLLFGGLVGHALCAVLVALTPRRRRSFG